MKIVSRLLLMTLLVAGCATPKPRPTPLGMADIISLTKAGVADSEIIQRIDETRSVYRLGAEDIVMLRGQGVSERVVNYMLETYTRAALAEQQRRDYDYHYRFQFHYGYPWWCW